MSADPSKLRRLKSRREIVKMSLRTLRSDISNPAMLERSIAHDQQQIEVIQSRILANQRRIDTMHETHDATRDELASINKQIKLEDNSVKIRALKRVAQSLAAISIKKDAELARQPEAADHPQTVIFQ